MTIARTSSAVTAALAEAGTDGADDGDEEAALLSTRDRGAGSARMDSISSWISWCT